MSSLFWIGLGINWLEYMYNYMEGSPYIHISLIGSSLMIVGLVNIFYKKTKLNSSDKKDSTKSGGNKKE